MLALLKYVPVVDLYREASHISVQPNGGNVESFHIDLPRDRVLAGMPGMENLTPYGVEWPRDKILAGSQAEIFKIRDSNNTVIGVASRMASNAEATGAFIEWMLHLPARGSMFISMQLGTTHDGSRSGVVRAGTGEFARLSGEIHESLLTNLEDADDGVDSRLQFVSILTGPLEEVE